MFDDDDDLDDLDWRPYGVSVTARQYRNALKKLGLRQSDAANLLGVSVRAAHSWANDVPVPEPVALLLRMMIKYKIRPEDLKRI
jgi:DNA-binding transcriptional regulator YiaG